MSTTALLVATIFSVVVIYLTYIHVGMSNVRRCYSMFLTKDYWVKYNVIEFVSWLVKAIIIVPGLLFDIQHPVLYLIALFTSVALIWASNKKLLPTLVWFNSLWIWLSSVALAKQLWTIL